MSHILRRLPFGLRTVEFQRQSFRTREDQIIVWLSIDTPDASIWNPSNVRFPAILDSGNSHNLLLTRQHMIRWIGFQPEYFEQQKMVRLGAAAIPQCRANIWLHHNQTGQRDQFSSRRPFLLNCPNGIVICADAHPQAPRLPLLGLRALVRNELVLTVHGAQKCVHLRTSSRWWWPF